MLDEIINYIQSLQRQVEVKKLVTSSLLHVAILTLPKMEFGLLHSFCQ